MIRAWLVTWRRHRAAWAGERAWKRDRRRHPDERIALRDAQIAELRDQLAAKDVAYAALEREAAQLRVSTATALTMQWLQRGAADTRRLAEEPTAVVSADQLRRTRPAGPAPATEQWGPR